MSESESAISGKVTVRAPVERAFKVFTESFGTWWPAGYHIGAAELADAVLEPHVGGRWFEKGVDGSECDWGHVLAWEPPHRVVLTWQINGRWEFDPDPARASEVEVRFTADGPDQTTVELVHRHIDRLVEAEAMRDSVGGEKGWRSLLQHYAKAVAG